jgi:hypothetical protein
VCEVHHTVHDAWILTLGQLGSDVPHTIIFDVLHEQLVTQQASIDVQQKRFECAHVYFFTSSVFSFFFLGATISAALIVFRRSGGGQSIDLGKNFAALSEKSSISIHVENKFSDAPRTPGDRLKKFLNL